MHASASVSQRGGGTLAGATGEGVQPSSCSTRGSASSEVAQGAPLHVSFAATGSKAVQLPSQSGGASNARAGAPAPHGEALVVKNCGSAHAPDDGEHEHAAQDAGGASRSAWP